MWAWVLRIPPVGRRITHSILDTRFSRWSEFSARWDSATEWTIRAGTRSNVLSVARTDCCDLMGLLGLRVRLPFQLRSRFPAVQMATRPVKRWAYRCCRAVGTRPRPRPYPHPRRLCRLRPARLRPGFRTSWVRWQLALLLPILLLLLLP